jgi:predicted tellurium resistance membrane protein TerC
MRLFNIDAQYLIISALISLLVTIAIVFLVNSMQPGLIVLKGGTSLFIYIGVFTANLIIEASRQRSERNRKR